MADEYDLLKERVLATPVAAQTQVSLHTQVRCMRAVATRLGLYDAVDWLNGAYPFDEDDKSEVPNG